jgi:hypothetical protein
MSPEQLKIMNMEGASSIGCNVRQQSKRFQESLFWEYVKRIRITTLIS